ncbi:hypothetical protein C8R46DRAFT_378490 [Mycena filopes]|nr:hypothetical protein C8R46DRAFT_378490 [Mycena filopes]
MALQTEVPTSTTSSSTTGTAVPSPTPTDTDGGGFSLSASPPLILAFLAVGVFGIAMVVFCGWRRIAANRNRTWVTTRDSVSVAPPTPKLWDVWSPPQDGGVAAEWHNIQPLSATTWDDRPPLPVPAHNTPPAYEGLFAEAVAHLRRRYRPRRSPDVEMGGKAKATSPAQLPVRLQIAVAIAMPVPDFNDSRTEPDEQPLDYTIGVYEVPWKTTH